MDRNDVHILGLSTLADLSLRNEGIPYSTPNGHFSTERYSEIDARAYSISQTWYETLDADLESYRGVSIGAVLEYDLYHLLVDALRNVEIASAVLRDSFDVIYLPSSDPAVESPGLGFHAVCYQTLPPIISDMARKRGVKVERLGPTGGVTIPDAETGYKVPRDQGFLTSSALFLTRNRRDLLSLMAHRRYSRIALRLCETCQDEMIRHLRGTEARGVKAFPGLVHNRRSKEHVSRLLDHLRDEVVLSRLDGSIVHGDDRFWRAIYPFVDEVLSRLIYHIVGRVNWSERFVKLFRPDAFVVFEDITPLSRAMCQVLRDRGVRIVVVQHGILTNDMAGMYLLPKVGDVQAVWGEYYKEWHVKRGMPADSQVVTGFPRYDKLVRMPQIDQGNLCKQFGLDPEKKMVMIATEWYQPVSARYTIEMEEEFIRLALRVLKSHDVQIVVKLHPGHQDRYHRIVSEIADQEGVKVIVVRNSLWELIQLSSLVIASVSTVGVEANLLGRPVVCVVLVDQRDVSGLAENNLVISAFNEEGLRESVNSIIKAEQGTIAASSDAGRGIDYFIDGLDGHASKRVLELCGSFHSVRTN
ncbi:MAG: CDP-glycerol glycerophosphotransferase family protein [Methanobacteriota archaeon]|nr:MAG: CDP-glycerol glycerophosphotransferase family protein [Euryarchaeota archaeon]